MFLLPCFSTVSLLLGRLNLTAQWDRILAAGPLYPVTLDDLSVRGTGIGDFHRVVVDVHHRLSDFTVGMNPFGDGGI